MIIWVCVFLITSVRFETDDMYNCMAPRLLKKLGNPLSTKKDITLTLALVRIFNNIFCLMIIVSYFIMPNVNEYWKYFGGHYLFGIIISFGISIIIEEICVSVKKKRDNRNVFGNILIIVFFAAGSLWLLYLYSNLISKGSIF